jgi:hypothetical protein
VLSVSGAELDTPNPSAQRTLRNYAHVMGCTAPHLPCNWFFNYTQSVIFTMGAAETAPRFSTTSPTQAHPFGAHPYRVVTPLIVLNYVSPCLDYLNVLWTISAGSSSWSELRRHYTAALSRKTTAHFASGFFPVLVQSMLRAECKA